MRQQRSQRRSVTHSASFDLNQAASSGQLVAEVINVSYSHNDTNTIISDFNTTILRGDKIGIIGPNGCGKSTLIKLLTGELAPSSGTIKLGTRLESAYLDQQRTSIRDDRSLIDNIAEGRSEVQINGKSVHIMTYIQDFLFPPSRAQTPAAALSGGERNRLTLAKLFTKPFSLLILDEPTNDLDIDTLELLEQKLVDYQGTLLSVSHDRTFLNNIVTSTLVFEGDGHVNEYIGGYDDWLRQHKSNAIPVAKPEASKIKAKQKHQAKPRKLSYNDQRELETLPDKIEKLESELEQLQVELANPDFYQQQSQIISQTNDRLNVIQSELETTYKRWEEFESI